MRYRAAERAPGPDRHVPDERGGGLEHPEAVEQVVVGDLDVALQGERADAQRLAVEAALLADKGDISEEIARLASHCEQFAQALVADDPVGRKLEEMNREINTRGSKAAEHPVSARVVDMKSVLERMREQAANVE